MKFTTEQVKNLIEARNTPEMTEEFKMGEGNPYRLKELWELVKKNAGLPDHDLAEIQKKYGDLLGDFRKQVLLSTKSGAGTSKWKWWNVFETNLKTGRELSPPIIFDSSKSSGLSIVEEERIEDDNALLDKHQNAEDSTSFVEDSFSESTVIPDVKRRKNKQDPQIELLTSFINSSNAFKNEISSSLKTLTEGYSAEITALKKSISAVKDGLDSKLDETLTFMKNEQKTTNLILMKLLERRDADSTKENTENK